MLISNIVNPTVTSEDVRDATKRVTAINVRGQWIVTLDVKDGVPFNGRDTTLLIRSLQLIQRRLVAQYRKDSMLRDLTQVRTQEPSDVV